MVIPSSALSIAPTTQVLSPTPHEDNVDLLRLAIELIGGIARFLQALAVCDQEQPLKKKDSWEGKEEEYKSVLSQ